MSKEITKLMYEQLEEKNRDLIIENQEMRSKILSLQRANHGLLQALNETNHMLLKHENKGLARI